MAFYDKILDTMQTRYKDRSGIIPDDASDIGIRLKVVAGELSVLYDKFEELEKQLFVQTSDSEYLDMHAQQRGLERKQGTHATGSLVFSRQNLADTDIIVPKGCMVSIHDPKDDNDYYATTQAGKMTAGTKTVTIPAQSSVKGITGNCSRNMIKLIVSGASGITAVNNPAPFSGGSSPEPDNLLKMRVMNSYENVSNGANSAYYYNLAAANPNVKFVKIMPKNRGIGTVDIFIHCHNTTDQTAAINEIKKIVSTRREICVDCQVAAAVSDIINIELELQVKSGFAFDIVKTNCTNAINVFFDNLKIGQPLLLTHLGRQILSVSGVLNYRFRSGQTDTAIQNNHIAKIGQISIIAWG